MWHKLQGGRLCLDFPEFCLRGMTPDFLRSVPSKMLHFFSHYFTARFISCSDTFVSIYPRLPLSYHESALGSQGTPTFLLLQSAFSHGFPMVFLSFSHGFPMIFPFSHGFPMVFPFSHGFPMIFPFSHGFPHGFCSLRPCRLWPSSSPAPELRGSLGGRLHGGGGGGPGADHRGTSLPDAGPRGETTTGPVPDLEEVHVYVKYMYDYVCMYIYNYLWLLMFINVSIICIYICNGMEWYVMLCLIRTYE